MMMDSQWDISWDLPSGNQLHSSMMFPVFIRRSRIFQPRLIAEGQPCILAFVNTLWLFNIAMENGPFIGGLPGFTY